VVAPYMVSALVILELPKFALALGLIVMPCLPVRLILGLEDGFLG